MSKTFDVVTLGSATVDVFADTDSELIRIETRTRKEELIAFPLGSKLLMKEMLMTTGGGGTNTAVAMARLGLRVGFLGKVGTDPNGDHVIDRLSRDHVDFLGTREGQTGFSVVLDSIHDDRTILAFKGINDHIHLADMPVVTTQWLYISSLMNESFESLLKWIPGTQANIAFNPSNYQVTLGLAVLKPLIDRTELLVMNREEACKLLGLSFEESPPIPDLLRGLARLPPRYLVITDGADGVNVYDRTTWYRGHPAKYLSIKETTGAGDAFAATLTAAIVMGLTLRDAIHMAMTNAESVLTQRGAKEGLLTLTALQSRLSMTERVIEEFSLLAE